MRKFLGVFLLVALTLILSLPFTDAVADKSLSLQDASTIKPLKPQKAAPDLVESADLPIYFSMDQDMTEITLINPSGTPVDLYVLAMDEEGFDIASYSVFAFSDPKGLKLKIDDIFGGVPVGRITSVKVVSDDPIRAFQINHNDFRHLEINALNYDTIKCPEYEMEGCADNLILKNMSLSFESLSKVTNPIFKLPLPANKSWLLTVQIGGKTLWGGSDYYHTDAANGYYALDFDDYSKENGQEIDVPVLAAAAGTVASGTGGTSTGGWGYTVVIDHGNGFTTRYAHLKSFPSVTIGNPVTQGQKIGVIGDTGNSAGSHLHFQMYYNGLSKSTTTQLQGITIDGKSIESYKVGTTGNKLYYLSTNTNNSCADFGEPNGAFSSAYSISCGATKTAKICSASDLDFYKVTPAASGTMTVTLMPPSDKDYDLYIYNSSQQLISSSTYGIGSRDMCAPVVAGGQTYYIKVYGYSGAYSTSSDYRLGISCPVATTPTLLVDGGSSSTRAQGGTFTLTGSNYTPNGTITRYINGTATTSITASSSGTIASGSWTWPTSCTTATGTYSVKTYDAGKKLYSNTITETVTANSSCSSTKPTAPSSMSASALSSSSIKLTWADSSNNETGFYLYRWNGSTWSKIATLGANATTYTDTGLSANTLYYYAVESYNSAGSSWLSQSPGYVSATTTTGTTPTLLIDGSSSSTRAQGGTFTLTGSNYTPNGTITRYINGIATTSITASSSGTIASGSWTWPTNCTTATGTYSVKTYDAGKQLYSNTVNEIVTANSSCSSTKPTAPSSMSASAVSSSSIKLTWADSSNNETGFYLYRWNGSTWSKIATLGVNTTTYTDTGLSANTLYYYAVESYNSAGSSWLSQSPGYVSATTTTGTTPTLLIDGSSSSTRAQGGTFTLTGSNFTPNGTINRYVNGTAISSITASSSGTIASGSWTWPTDCTTATGTYSVRTYDVGKQLYSNTVNEIVTANSSCNTNLPNLTPYKPSAWADKIIVHKTMGAITDSSPLYSTDALYVGWVVINQGTSSISTTFYTKLYVDGVLKNTWNTASLQATYYTWVNDYSIGTLSAGTHTIKIVTDATGVISESNESDNEYTKTITVQASSSTPTLLIDGSSSSTRAQGGTFTLTGSDFTPNGTINRYVNGTAISSITASSSGTIASGSWTWPTDCTTVPGTYSVKTYDAGKQLYSNTVNEIVTANSSCGAPTLLVDGSSSSSTRAQGGTFTLTGSNFTPNGTINRYVNGTAISSITASSSGTIASGSWTWPTDCTIATGTYSVRTYDVGKKLYSNTVNETVTASSTCNQVNPTIAQTPMSGTPGTTFVEWGTGFTPNSTAKLYFPKYDGVNNGTANQSIDSQGHFEISYPSGSNKPRGFYEWYGVDGPTGIKSNVVRFEIK